MQNIFQKRTEMNQTVKVEQSPKRFDVLYFTQPSPSPMRRDGTSHLLQTAHVAHTSVPRRVTPPPNTLRNIFSGNTGIYLVNQQGEKGHFQHCQDIAAGFVGYRSSQ